MMQKRTLTSLLLISFLVAFAFSYALGQDEVVFDEINTARCNTAGVVNITVNSSVDLSAVELVFTISKDDAPFTSYTVDWDPAFTALGTRFGPFIYPGTDYDTVRMAAIKIAPTDTDLPATPTQVVKIDFEAGDFCEGQVLFDNAVLDGGIPAVVTTKLVEAAGNTVIPVTVVPGSVTYVNSPPVLDPIANVTVPWGDPVAVTATATDPDMANGCEALTYSLTSGSPGFINATSGEYAWITDTADICETVVGVIVTDDCDGVDTTEFTVCVTNEPPVIDSITVDQPTWVTGDDVTGKIWATDPDGGPVLTYHAESLTGPGTVVVNPSTGEFSWQTVPFDDDYVGNFTLCFTATDNANTCDPCSPANADTACVDVDILKALLVIDKLHGPTGDGVIQGQFYKVPVFFDGNAALGGYNLLITYDASALTFIKAYRGGLLDECDWEYFTYRTGPFGNCGGGCPTGQVRITAIAEYNDGPNHPDCFGTWPVDYGGNSYPAADDSVLVELEFLVSSDANFGCQFIPISFWWIECGDNTLSDVSGKDLYISRSVWRYAGGEGDSLFSEFPDAYVELTSDPVFPGGFGHLDTCAVGNENPDKPRPIRAIDFWNGGIDIICPDVIDDRGDLNLNAVPYEIADAVIFSNYFIYGQSAFEILAGSGATPEQKNLAVAAATAASDVNGDGLTLTVADLVQLVRVIVGDAFPLPNSPLPKTNALNAQLVTLNGILSDDAGLEYAAAYLELRGDATVELLANNMVLKSDYVDGVTKVLIHAPFDGNTSLETFTGNFLDIHGAEVLHAELATSEGQPVYLNVLPSDYALKQNYPNPFNPSTTIEFALPVASNYKLTIINVTGQVVKEFNGAAEAGVHSVVWNASDNASGVYFYRLALDANNSVETKKMVLLK